MQNRFGVKDLVIIVLLVMMLISVWLGIGQFDRQWEDVQALKSQLDQQARDISELHRMIKEMQPKPEEDESGASLDDIPGELVAQNEGPQDPFERICAARRMEGFAQGGWMLDSFGTQVHTLTPLVSSDAYASIVQSFVLESLCERDPETLELTGLLATDWKVYDNTKAYFEWETAAKTKASETLGRDRGVLDKVITEIIEEYERAGATVEPGTPQYEGIVKQAEKRWMDRTIREDSDRPVPIYVLFDLRPDASFADGRTLTSRDVVFTFDWIMNPKVAAPRQRSYFSMIRKVKAAGPRRVLFEFDEPYFEAFALAAQMIVLPEHYYSKLDYEAFNTSKGLLFGSGPFRLPNPEGWSPSETVALVRNDRYWGERPALDRVVFTIYTQDVARQTAFRNGEIDMLPASPEQYAKMLEDDELVARAKHFEYMTPYNGYRYIAWNQVDTEGKPSKFADKRVRQALTMLIDRPRMIDEIMRGYAEISTGPFNPLGFQNSPNVSPWPHDVERAKALLAEAGWEAGGKGRNHVYQMLVAAIALPLLLLALFSRFAPMTVRMGAGALLFAGVVATAALIPSLEREKSVLYNREGEPFRFKLTYPSGSTNYDKMVLQLKDSYAKAGIILEPDPLEFSVMVERLNNASFEAITLGWTSGPETDINQMFHSSEIKPGGDNFMAYRSPDLDEYIEKARRTIDEEERMAYWHKCHEIMHEDQPYTFLFWGKSLRFVDNRMGNVQLLRSGMNPRTEWFIPSALQRHTR